MGRGGHLILAEGALRGAKHADARLRYADRVPRLPHPRAIPRPAAPVRFASAGLRRRAAPLLRRLPELAGAPLRVEAAPQLRDRRGPVHAGAFIRQRRIALACGPAEFPRILAHELFHFAWVRAGNPARRSFEALLTAEIAAGARGELGWSAEWRKRALVSGDLAGRTRRWREYCCESFCDTAAFLFSGVGPHPEFTLAGRFARRRRAWFERIVGNGPVPV